MIVLVCLIVALVAFLLGAFGVQAVVSWDQLGAAGVTSHVSWDQLGKCLLVAALIAMRVA